MSMKMQMLEKARCHGNKHAYNGAFKLGLRKITYIRNSNSSAPLAAAMIDTHVC